MIKWLLLLILLCCPAYGYEVNFDIQIELYGDSISTGFYFETYGLNGVVGVELSDNTQKSFIRLVPVSENELRPITVTFKTTGLITNNTIIHVKGTYNEVFTDSSINSLFPSMSGTRFDSEMGIGWMDDKSVLH